MSEYDVTSSKTTIGASFKKALAIERRCISPPESLIPEPSPITVSYPSFKLSINVCI